MREEREEGVGEVGRKEVVSSVANGRISTGAAGNKWIKRMKYTEFVITHTI